MSENRKHLLTLSDKLRRLDDRVWEAMATVAELLRDEPLTENRYQALLSTWDSMEAIVLTGRQDLLNNIKPEDTNEGT